MSKKDVTFGFNCYSQLLLTEQSWSHTVSILVFAYSLRNQSKLDFVWSILLDTALETAPVTGWSAA